MVVVVPFPSSSMGDARVMVRSSWLSAMNIRRSGEGGNHVVFSAGSDKSESLVDGESKWFAEHAMTGGDSFEVLRARITVQNGTSAVSACVKYASEYLYGAMGDVPVAVLPPNWYAPRTVVVDSACSALSGSSPVVMLGGWYEEESNGFIPGRLVKYDDLFYRVELDNCTPYQLFSPDSPCVASLKAAAGRMYSSSYDRSRIMVETNFGRNPPYVLFPRKLHSRVGDGLPTALFDVVGIRRQFRNRCRGYDAEIEKATGLTFKP